MKAKDVGGIVRLALNERVSKIGYVDFEDFLVGTNLKDEELTEVIWIIKDLLDPYYNDKRMKMR